MISAFTPPILSSFDERNIITILTTASTANTVIAIFLSLAIRLIPSSSASPLPFASRSILMTITPNASARHTSVNLTIHPLYADHTNAITSDATIPIYTRLAFVMTAAAAPRTIVTSEVTLTAMLFVNEVPRYAPIATGTSTQRKLPNMSILPNVDMYILCISTPRPSRSFRKSAPMYWHRAMSSTTDPTAINTIETILLTAHPLAIHR